MTPTSAPSAKIFTRKAFPLGIFCRRSTGETVETHDALHTRLAGAFRQDEMTQRARARALAARQPRCSDFIRGIIWLGRFSKRPVRPRRPAASVRTRWAM